METFKRWKLAFKECRFVLTLLSMALVTGLWGCGRSAPNTSATLRFQVPEGQNSVLNGSLELGFIMINIRASGQPLYKRAFEFHDGRVPAGVKQDANGIEMELKGDIPTGPALIQYLSVYRDKGNGVEVFYYGDKQHNIAAGQNAVDLVASNFAQSSKQAEVAGRFLTDSNEGPTGKLVMSFQPPNGSPRMSLEETEIINGWFSIFLLDGAPLTYTLKGTGQDLFKNVTLSSPGFRDSDMGTHRVKFQRPKVYWTHDNDGEVGSEADFIVGFFSAPGASVDLGSYNVCAFDVEETIPYMSTDALGQSPLIYRAGGTPAASEVGYIAGSPTEISLFDHIAETSPDCDVASGQSVMFYHNLLSHEGPIGREGPFRLINPLAQFDDGYVNGTYDSRNDENVLSWDYMPGITPNDVRGVEIFVRSHHDGIYDGGGGGFNEPPCPEEALQRGYQLLGVVINDGSLASRAFRHPLSGQYPSNFDYKLCPFSTTAQGQVYFDGVRAPCIECGGGGNPGHYGWGVDEGIATHGTFEGSLGGRTARVNDIDGSNAKYTTIHHSDSDDWASANGFELMIRVMAMGQSPEACGPNIYPGNIDFTRVLQGGTGTVKIPKGTLLDRVTASGTSLTASSGTNFCNIQIVVIPHFKNLDLGNFQIGASAFGFGDSGGGIVAFRVNGTLTLGSGGYIDASGKGFPAGSGSNAYGGGIGGDGSSENSHTGGESSVPLGAGGAGYGRGANTLGNTAVGGHNMAGGTDGPLALLLGGAGGAATNGGVPGGHGGGAIFIAAKQINIAGSGYSFKANGMSGNDNSSYYSGGGGGGSVHIISHKIYSDNGHTFTVEAKGGIAMGGAGGGGGGLLRVMACEGDLQNLVEPLNSAGTGGDSSALAEAGNGQGGTYPPIFNEDHNGQVQPPYYCNYARDDGGTNDGEANAPLGAGP